MTQFFVVLFSLCSLTSSAQKLHYLDWTAAHRLTWNDFKARPETGSNNAALTSSSIDIKYSVTSTGLKYSIQCRFDKDLSWGRVKTNHILAHEQGHFDIAEVYARKLNMALKDYTFDNRHAERDINRIYQRVMDEHHRTQKRYDRETDYSRNRAKQRDWLSRISGMLEDNRAYANYRSPSASRYSRNSEPSRSPAHSSPRRRQ